MGCVTVVDVLQRSYGRRLGALVYLPSCLGDVCWTAAVLTALGGSLEALLMTTTGGASGANVIDGANRTYASFGTDGANSTYASFGTDGANSTYASFGADGANGANFTGAGGAGGASGARAAAIVLSAAVAAAYTLAGGMRAVAATDAAQLLLVALGLGAAVPFVLASEEVDLGRASLEDWTGSVSAAGAVAYIDTLLMILLGGLPWQPYYQRALSLRYKKSPKPIKLFNKDVL